MPAEEDFDIRVFRTRLRPTPAQVKELQLNCDATRWAYNRALQENRSRYDNKKTLEYLLGRDLKGKDVPEEYKFLSPQGLNKELTKWKTDTRNQWTHGAINRAMQEKFRDLNNTWKEFFKGKRGYPKWRSRHRHNSFREYYMKIDGNRICIPKVGWVRAFEEMPLQIQCQNANISKVGEKWWVSVQWRIPKLKPAPNKKPEVGIDMGIAKWATCSDGWVVDAPEGALKELDRLQKRRLFYQKKLSRRAKGSSRRIKAREQLAKVSERIAQIKRNWSHTISKHLVEKYGKIALEELAIANMTKSAKGTTEKPGKNVKAKAGLNRSILAQNWYQFRQYLEYKMRQAGGELVMVDPQYTSQTCSSCGHVDAKNRISQEKFKCVKCGHAENADLNASRNIFKKAFGG